MYSSVGNNNFPCAIRKNKPITALRVYEETSVLKIFLEIMFEKY